MGGTPRDRVLNLRCQGQKDTPSLIQGVLSTRHPRCVCFSNMSLEDSSNQALTELRSHNAHAVVTVTDIKTYPHE